MPDIELVCYNCEDHISIPFEDINQFMEEYHFCTIKECQTNEMCSECSNKCDKCMDVFCKEHFNGITRMCIECDPKEENN